MSTAPPNDDSTSYPDVVIDNHEYDGIKEYDNPMPAWWLWLFYATIAWSIFYVAALGVGWIDDYGAQLEGGQAAVADQQAAYAAAQDERDAVEVDEDYLAGLVDDSDALTTGEEVYGKRCATCHGTDGDGGVGPAFDDGDWVHGPALIDHYEVIRDGVAAEGMPAHDSLLSDEEMAAVAAFIDGF